MVETDKPKRTVDDIHREYTQLCARAGQLQYQLVTLKKDLDVINEQLRDLNFEAAKLVAETPKQTGVENAKS